MPVSTYEELLAHYNVNSSLMEQTFSDDHLIEFSSKLDEWEKLSLSLKIPSSEIEDIKSQGGKGMKGIRLLQCWKQRYGSKATYKTLVEALVQIGRIDLAEKVITLRRSLKDVTHSPPSPSEISQATPTSPASSSGIEDVSPPGAMSPSTELANAGKQMKQSVTLTLTELEEEFYRLVMYVEAALKASEVHVDTIKSRFRMLPQSVRRQLQTDENYKETRQKILDSKTIKELFDNLTALKHWSYMMPDTLEHILKDINNDDIHQKIKQYKRKLMAFKASTKLRELIGISFPVPDYCMELTMEVEGWENKTIQEVENRSVNIVRRASYGSPHVSLGWKGVMPGSIKVMFILMESLKLISKKLLNDKGIISVHVDGDILHNNDYTKAAVGSSEVPHRLWGSTETMRYNAVGGRDVLILAADLSLPRPKAVTRRPGQLTEEDRVKLLSQGLPPHVQDDITIVKARYELVKCKAKSRLFLSRYNAIKSIAHLLNSTQNDGVVLHYIGASRRGTGDWCFEDGFITFRDIAQLYLRASHNFKGRVLTIISDCSYSGCWVRDCMEFLDEQGVQPCGHKAREKGMVIKVFTSCKSNEIPTEYRFSVSGIENDKDTGVMGFWPSEQLLETQTTDYIDSSLLTCTSKTIDEPCILQRGLTWRKLD